MSNDKHQDIESWKASFAEHIHKEYDPNVKDFFITLDHMLELVDKFKAEDKC